MGIFDKLFGGHKSRDQRGSGHHSGGSHGFRHGVQSGGTASSAIGIACPGCKAMNDGYSKFCRQCGTSLGPTVCKRCGSSVHPTASFCSQCGASID
ncbi:MAG: zinc ribbon domain-containing protein [Burkholderiales bacterium]|uniref:double zinc ribbon domain-containing protein n=1 Tax=Pigmentiphaga humi TaxID=2478468 RepID=UPI000F53B920|nr:zinc ribbon domain-containing protein [Burkholderiales bacterium]